MLVKGVKIILVPCRMVHTDILGPRLDLKGTSEETDGLVKFPR
jgi:hypothetical protein